MTNILTLPPISGSFAAATNGDWRASIAFAVSGVAVDITGIAFRMQARASSSSAAIALEASTDNGLLINGGASGLLSVVAPAAVMETIAAGTYVADLIAEADGATINCSGPGALTLNVGQGITTP